MNFFWFRRDLRLEDNVGLWQALKSGLPVQCVFIFDTNILDRLENKRDRRLVFIYRQLEKLNKELVDKGSFLMLRYGDPETVLAELCMKFSPRAVFVNEDYEPYARQRDQAVAELVSGFKTTFHSFKDQVIFNYKEVLKDDGSPYTVFTPYMNKWKKILSTGSFDSCDNKKLSKRFRHHPPETLLALSDIGFENMKIDFPEPVLRDAVLKSYVRTRDIPAANGTSRLSVHLRFGTVSVRKLFRQAWSKSEKWINELIWREFYMSILWHFPEVVNRAFKTKYDRLEWRQDEEGFLKWCNGMTGYPIVDAGMRELITTGFMHNRLRMITAMFLTKYLLIDWRWGESYFAQQLLDFELSSNNGGWQWSAGTGVDAAPYFRIFNMDEQQKKYDPDFEYIRKWVPEFNTEKYPQPIVDYKFARERCLNFFRNGLSE